MDKKKMLLVVGVSTFVFFLLSVVVVAVLLGDQGPPEKRLALICPICSTNSDHTECDRYLKSTDCDDRYGDICETNSFGTSKRVISKNGEKIIFCMYRIE